MGQREARRNVLPAAYSALNEAAIGIRELAGTIQSKLTVDLLRLIEAQYLEQLRVVNASELAELQGKLAQTTALIELFEGKPHSTGVV